MAGEPNTSLSREVKKNGQKQHEAKGVKGVKKGVTKTMRKTVRKIRIINGAKNEETASKSMLH